jgi:hypothetical protein
LFGGKAHSHPFKKDFVHALGVDGALLRGGPRWGSRPWPCKANGEGQARRPRYCSPFHQPSYCLSRERTRLAPSPRPESGAATKEVTLRGGDVDESPMAYRRLPEVLKYHAGTIKVLHTLSHAVVMAGPGEFDPYKD